MILEKLININPLFDTILGGTISEFDIKSAGATAIREIKGEEVYNSLMNYDKKTRNVKIGLMMRDEPGLSDRVNKLMLDWLNLFIRENKIKNSNFVYTTRDSIVIYNKIPMKTKFGNVVFRNKDGIFSSMFRIRNITIFFDSMRGYIMVKGLGDSISEKSDFINKYLVKILFMIEGLQNSNDIKIFNTLKYMRNLYMKSNNTAIYRDVLNDNKLGIRYNDELVYVENDLELENSEDNENFTIAKDLNYINIILPIMRSVLTRG